MVYVETVSDTPVGGALEVLTKAHKLAEARGEEVIAVLIGRDLVDAARTAIMAGADRAVIVKKRELSDGGIRNSPYKTGREI